jgi:hypothetical protein
MPTLSANLSQTPISGRYGRVFVSADGTNLYPVNLNKWSMHLSTDDIDTTGFEAAGYSEGITGIVRAVISLEGPYQISRTSGLAAPGMNILSVGRFIYYNLWTVHPDNNANLGSLHRYAGIAQVIETPHDQEVKSRSNLTVTCHSRGPIYVPGTAEAITGVQQMTYYATGILSGLGN